MRLLGLCIVFVFLQSALGQQLPSRPTQPCIASEEFVAAKVQLEQTHHYLRSQGKLSKYARKLTKLAWPLRPKPTFADPSYYTILQYADHDESFGSTRDYNCGHRTYDIQGYNHSGTDIGLWPFPWKMLEEGQVEVIAAADGYISAKSDGGYDRVCVWGAGSAANYVIVTHPDGSQTWYWHLKEGSVTSKDIGAQVKQGDYLGLVASSGFSNYPHLHFEVRDADGHFIDPYTGPCNKTNSTSWWDNQPAYWQPAIVKLSTNRGVPFYTSCPKPELTREQKVFNPGDEVYFFSFTRDLRKDQQVNYRILDEENTVFATWTFENTYDAWSEYRYWTYRLPVNESSGIWTFEAEFSEDTYTKIFEVTNECLPPADLATEKITSTDITLTWSTLSPLPGVLAYRSNEASNFTYIALEDGATSHHLNKLSPSTNYHWRLAKVCSPGDTSWAEGPEFQTEQLYYFDPEIVNISPSPAKPADEVWIEISGLKKSGAYLQSSSVLTHKENHLELQLTWLDTIPTDFDFKPFTARILLGKFLENTYTISFSGIHWNYARLQDNYVFEVRTCPAVSFDAEPWSATTMALYSNLLEYPGEQVIRYRIKEGPWTYDTLTRTLCINPPCPVFISANLEFRRNQLFLKNLLPCFTYELQIKMDCLEETYTKGIFITTFCVSEPCPAPFNIKIDEVALTQSLISWEDSIKPNPFDNYTVTYRQMEDDEWQEVSFYEGGLNPTGLHYDQTKWYPGCLCEQGCFRRPLLYPLPKAFNLKGLLPCTSYELNVQRQCLDSSSSIGQVLNIQTLCDETPDKYAYSLFPEAAGITKLIINGQEWSDSCTNCLGCQRPGYQSILQTIQVASNQPLTIQWESMVVGQKYFLDPAGRFYPFPVGGMISVYADLDENGTFERILYTSDTLQELGNTNVQLPAFQNQYLNMRMVFSYLDPPHASGRIHFGNVIDFTLDLGSTTSTPLPDSNINFSVYPNPAKDYVTLGFTPQMEALNLYIANLDGKILEQHDIIPGQKNIPLALDQLPDGVYLIYALTTKTRGVQKLVIKK